MPFVQTVHATCTLRTSHMYKLYKPHVQTEKMHSSGVIDSKRSHGKGNTRPYMMALFLFFLGFCCFARFHLEGCGLILDFLETVLDFLNIGLVCIILDSDGLVLQVGFD